MRVVRLDTLDGLGKRRRRSLGELPATPAGNTTQIRLTGKLDELAKLTLEARDAAAAGVIGDLQADEIFARYERFEALLGSLESIDQALAYEAELDLYIEAVRRMLGYAPKARSMRIAVATGLGLTAAAGTVAFVYYLRKKKR